MVKKKVAIACQGGGSQTAFTAGVLKFFDEKGVFETYDIVSFSGTSGGAVCAAISWYSLLEKKGDGTMKMSERLENFWKDNSTNNNPTRIFQNQMATYLMRMIDSGRLFELKSSPFSPLAQMIRFYYKIWDPDFYDFEKLIRKYIKFEKLKELVIPDSPVLLVSAANVMTGEFKKFSSLKNEINVESILASAAVPSIFEPVKIKNQYYWDGLYSENPPVGALTETRYVGKERTPEEIWVIQINPNEIDTIPDTPNKISDRKNELTGNLSLNQELKNIKRVNAMIESKSYTDKYIDKKKPQQIDLYIIPMSKFFQKKLDLTSKLDRSYSLITDLMEDGAAQGEMFVSEKEMFKYD